MISNLSIKNIALIDELNIEFDKGLNILTGETGAGKSIIIDSVNLVLGERADKELIQTGKDYAAVEVLFSLDDSTKVNELLTEFGIPAEEDNTLLLMRELSSQGKNTCRINGRMVTLSMLKQVTRFLVDIHGQHKHQALLQPESHIKMLDQLGGKELSDIKEAVKSTYHAWREIRQKIKKIAGITEDGERRKDLLIYQINEIESANLSPGEEDDLKKERELLLNAEKIINIVNEAYNELYVGKPGIRSITDSLSYILSKLSQIQSYDKILNETAANLEDISYRMEDAIMHLRDFKESLDFEPYRLDEIEKRLDVISNLKRKYGKSIEDILNLKEELEKELFELENSQESLDELNRQSERAFSQLVELCKELSLKREECAEKIEKAIMKELSELNMEKTLFKVSIEHPSVDQLDCHNDNSHISANGFDRVEFLISPNPGEPLKPLSKIISGGEMSRIMLAFKTILGNHDEIPTLIFDEIDVGISGRTAATVGDKMHNLSKSHQIICVTHLPQIAAKADAHFIIQKDIENDKTKTFVNRLDEEGKVHEIARMIGGTNITKLSLEHARELITNKN